MVNFTVRDATIKDAAQLSLLYKFVWNEQIDRFPNNLLHARQPNLTEMKEWLSRETSFVAIVEERIIGVVGCVMNFDNCKLIHMVVLKEYRKKGLGSALLEEVEKFANKNNAFKIWLDTSTRLKDSIKFYKSKGFRLVGILKKHFWGEDIVLFEKILWFFYPLLKNNKSQFFFFYFYDFFLLLIIVSICFPKSLVMI